MAFSNAGGRVLRRPSIASARATCAASASQSKGTASSSSRATIFQYRGRIESRLLVIDRPNPLPRESLTVMGMDEVPPRSWFSGRGPSASADTNRASRAYTLRTAGKSNEQRAMPYTHSPHTRRHERLTGVRLFVGDSVIAFRLLNEARHRIMSRTFGMPREHSNLITLFVLAAFVRGLKRAAAAPGNQVRKARSSPTAAGDTIIAAAMAKETVNSIAGPPARDTPAAAALIALALTVHAFRAPIRRLLHAVRQSLRHVAAAAHKARAVMRRWGISPSSIPALPGANSRAGVEDRAQ